MAEQRPIPQGTPGADQGLQVPPGLENEENPVIEALQTIQTFVAAQKESGNEKAGEMAKGLLGLIQAIGGTANIPGETQEQQQVQIPQRPAISPVGNGGVSSEHQATGSSPVVPSL